MSALNRFTSAFDLQHKIKERLFFEDGVWKFKKSGEKIDRNPIFCSDKL